jgi:outer membrane protein TolC
MFRYKLLTLLTICVLSTTVAAAQSVTLEQLIQAALEHHPYTDKMTLEQDLMRVKSDALRTVFWPDLSLNAQAGYQSLVPEFPIKVPGVSSPNIPKDRYQASLDVNQMIYDGGVMRHKQNMLKIEAQMAQTRIMAERYPIQQQVVDAWFGLEFVSIRRSILKLTLEDLEARHRTMLVGLDGGVVMQMDVDRISAELQRVRQKDAEIHADSTLLVAVLSEITGLNFTPQTVFVVSSNSKQGLSSIGPRPEERLLDLAAELADAKTRVEHLSRRPKVGGYAQGAYGKPGLDLFADTFSPFWQAGIRASWTLWDKGGSKRDQEINRIVKNQIEDDRELFNRSIRIAIRQQEAEIDRNKDLLSSDQEIIATQERIKAASEAKLDEGIINATDYLQDVRAVEQARLKYESRKITIRLAEVNINIIRGGL